MADIQTAREKFAAKEIADVLGICAELIGERKDMREACILAGKATLYVLDDLGDSGDRDTFLSSVIMANNEATTLEEVAENEREFILGIDEWSKYRRQQRFLNDYEQNPKFSIWNEMLEEGASILQFYEMMAKASMLAGVTKEYIEEHGEEAAEAFFDERREKVIFVQDLYTQSYEVAMRVFEQGKKIIERDRFGTDSEVRDAMTGVLERFLSVKQIVGSAASDPDFVENEAVYCERLKGYAEVLNYLLTLMVFPDGEEASFYCFADRAELVEDLEQTYDKIRELDLLFEAPELPSTEPVNSMIIEDDDDDDDTPVYNSGSGNTASGGCYVATAVYGSYDCPEVWTLRRFRDDTLAETWYGRAFIRTYYAISPTLVKWFGETKWFKNLWKPTLDRMVKNLNEKGVDNTRYNDREW